MRVFLATVLCIVLGGCGRSASSTLAAANDQSTLIRLPLAALTPELARTLQFNRDHTRDDVYAFGYVNSQALAALPASQLDEIDVLDAHSMARHAFDPKTLQLLTEEVDLPDAEGYHNYQALTAELQNLVNAHPDLATLTSAGKSVQGRELWVLKISDHAPADEAEPKLLYIANMHGDETAGREMMIYLARRLVGDYGVDARITELVDHAQIYLMPSMNPDGFELGQRHNARGVDLNRDFPDFTADPTDTPAGRAPETAAVMALHAQHHFVMALNFHGGEVCFNVPWDTKTNSRVADRFGDDALMQRVGRLYADQNATMRANSGGSFDRGLTYGYEWYEVDGGMQDWSIHYRGSIHATIELSYTKYPSANSLPGIWNENKEALLRYLEESTFGVHVRVVDDVGNPVPSPVVRVASLNRDVAYRSAFVHRPAMAGSQSVRVSAPGFLPTEVTLTPDIFAGTYQDVVLHR